MVIILYNVATDDLVIDGETSKVVLLNANNMKVKTIVNQDGITAESFSLNIIVNINYFYTKKSDLKIQIGFFCFLVML